ncbi:hypothetical protein BCR43DRAFT_498784 [Syncephalastrum racemosum]|uniref:Uncharacterized protein n=1 Tax=Syncephalastrum racemosum TaxID=13706 RepID=A0A1X2H1G5_SYNRA|nr:hypothetical protein BCR43DRAFT_498784 [Syncephalastrum racemosum]
MIVNPANDITYQSATAKGIFHSVKVWRVYTLSFMSSLSKTATAVKAIPALVLLFSLLLSSVGNHLLLPFYPRTAKLSSFSHVMEQRFISILLTVLYSASRAVFSFRPTPSAITPIAAASISSTHAQATMRFL